MTEVFFQGRKIMEYDFSPLTNNLSDQDKEELNYLFNDFWDAMRDIAYSVSGDEELLEEKIKEIWKGKESLRALGDAKYEMAKKETDDLFAMVDRQFELMEDELSKEDFEIWKKLRNMEVDIANQDENNDYYKYFTFKTNGYRSNTPDI